MLRIVLADEAQADALEAFRFYEDRREGLGERFRDHLDIALSRIQETPELYPVVAPSISMSAGSRARSFGFVQLAKIQGAASRCYIGTCEPISITR